MTRPKIKLEYVAGQRCRGLFVIVCRKVMCQQKPQSSNLHDKGEMKKYTAHAHKDKTKKDKSNNICRMGC